MPSWEEMHAASISAFSSVINDVGSTYQQILRGGAGLYQGNYQNSQAGYGQVNPQYTQADKAYITQEKEREYWEGITVDDYQPTDIDWEGYGQYVDEMRREQPDLYDSYPEPQDLEPER